MKIMIALLFGLTSSVFAGEFTDLHNGQFRIHSHNIISVTVKCTRTLGGRYSIFTKNGWRFNLYSSAITCLDEKWERERFEDKYEHPYEYVPYPLVYNFDFKKVGVRSRYLLTRIQIYPQKPSGSFWEYAPEVPYKDENGKVVHKFIHELLDETDFQDNCNWNTDLNLNLRECIAHYDEVLKGYWSEKINLARE